MPVLNPGAPTVVASDSQTFMAAANYYGMGWLAPVAGFYEGWTIDMNSLASEPKNSGPMLTAVDVALMLVPGNPFIASDYVPVMRNMVAQYLYDTNVSATGVEPPPPPSDPVDPGPGFVEPPRPDVTVNPDSIWTIVTRIENELTWLRQQVPTRHFFMFGNEVLTGTGSVTFPPFFNDRAEYSVSPMGFYVQVTEYPTYSGRSSDDLEELLYDAGEVSFGALSGQASPIKLMRLNHVIWPIISGEGTFVYNLRHGVTIAVQALYPYQLKQHVPD